MGPKVEFLQRRATDFFIRENRRSPEPPLASTKEKIEILQFSIYLVPRLIQKMPMPVSTTTLFPELSRATVGTPR